MYNIKTTLQLALTLLVWMAFNACNTKSTKTYADLLDRQDTIGKSTEWQEIQRKFKEYTTALEKDTNDANTRLRLAQIYLNEARIGGDPSYYYKGALQMLNSILSKPQQNPDYLFLAKFYKSSVLLSLHQFADAKVMAEEAMKINPSNGDIYGALVDANVELGNYAEAVRMCDLMIQIRPDLRSYSRASYLRQIHGDNAGAIQAMKMAVDAGPSGMESTEWARVNLADLYLGNGQTDTAKFLYESALVYRPNYPYAEMGLAKVAQARQQYDTAIAHCEKAIRIVSESSFISYLADLYELKGDASKAKEIRTDVLDLLVKGEAENEKETIAKHNGNRELATAYLNSNMLDKALSFAQNDLVLRPENIDANELVAWIYYLKNDYTNATFYADKMLKTNIQNANTLYKASVIYAAAGDPIRSNEMKSKALAINSTIDQRILMAGQQAKVATK